LDGGVFSFPQARLAWTAMFLLPERVSFFDGRIFGVPRVRLSSTAASLASRVPVFLPEARSWRFQVRLSSAAAVLEFQALSFFLSGNPGVLSAARAFRSRSSTGSSMSKV
jgi:hypothetical protein